MDEECQLPTPEIKEDRICDFYIPSQVEEKLGNL